MEKNQEILKQSLIRGLINSFSNTQCVVEQEINGKKISVINFGSDKSENDIKTRLATSIDKHNKLATIVLDVKDKKEAKKIANILKDMTKEEIQNVYLEAYHEVKSHDANGNVLTDSGGNILTDSEYAPASLGVMQFNLMMFSQERVQPIFRVRNTREYMGGENTERVVGTFPQYIYFLPYMNYSGEVVPFSIDGNPPSSSFTQVFQRVNIVPFMMGKEKNFYQEALYGLSGVSVDEYLDAGNLVARELFNDVIDTLGSASYGLTGIVNAQGLLPNLIADINLVQPNTGSNFNNKSFQEKVAVFMEIYQQFLNQSLQDTDSIEFIHFKMPKQYQVAMTRGNDPYYSTTLEQWVRTEVFAGHEVRFFYDVQLNENYVVGVTSPALIQVTFKIKDTFPVWLSVSTIKERYFAVNPTDTRRQSQVMMFTRSGIICRYPVSVVGMEFTSGTSALGSPFSANKIPSSIEIYADNEVEKGKGEKGKGKDDNN